MEDHVGNNTIYLNVHHSQTWILNNDDECRNVDDRVLWHKQYEKSIAERSARAQMAAAAKQTTNSNHEEPILKSSPSLNQTNHGLLTFSSAGSIPHSKGMFDKEKISNLKKGVLIVNNAQGAIMDTQAVVNACSSGYIKDVWYPQPAPKDHPWCYMLNQAITPHISGTIIDAQLFVVGFTLETRTSNEVWNIVAIIPVDKRMGSGNGGGSNGSSSSELIAEENFLKICNKLLLARGGELLKRTRKGT
ncbi:hypothetical protein FXO38_21160 [Capsicum annuum]|nr:hypothetical protein FXO38_21160 [Capsicum annuum]KAF3668992.1 hypothetical protein FXO37_09262 [Capsicum annuum]